MPSSPSSDSVVPPAEASADTLTANYTRNYNYINTMATPSVCAAPDKVSDVTGACAIDNPVRNFDQYAIAYPITGQVADAADSADFGTVTKNGYYAGPDLSLGSNYFDVMGKCGAGSVPECVGQDRSVYIRNITTGKIPLFGNLSLAGVTGTTSGVMGSNGILPSMMDVGLSAFGPTNLFTNLQQKGNIGGSSCRRVKLPVGTHIYDPQMKAPIDYTAVNQCTHGQPPDLQTRQFRTRTQVNKWLKGTHPVTGEETNPRSWWYEERCTPSYNWAVAPDSLLRADTGHGESAYLPSSKPLIDIEPTYDIQTLPAVTTDSCKSKPTARESFVAVGHAGETNRDTHGLTRGGAWMSHVRVNTDPAFRTASILVLVTLLVIAFMLAVGKHWTRLTMRL
jgi:hypothetical protein